MDIEARVHRIEMRLAELEARIVRLEKLIATRIASTTDPATDARVRREMIELKKMVVTDEEIPPPSKRH
jgi:hypothetical protein